MQLCTHPGPRCRKAAGGLGKIGRYNRPVLLELGKENGASYALVRLGSQYATVAQGDGASTEIPLLDNPRWQGTFCFFGKHLLAATFSLGLVRPERKFIGYTKSSPATPARKVEVPLWTFSMHCVSRCWISNAGGDYNLTESPDRRRS